MMTECVQMNKMKMMIKMLARYAWMRGWDVVGNDCGNGMGVEKFLFLNSAGLGWGCG